LFVVGIETQVLPNDDLHISINADLRIVAIVKIAFLAHDTGIRIGKANLFLSSISLPGTASLRAVQGLL
jgi:hypothetical protein